MKNGRAHGAANQESVVIVKFLFLDDAKQKAPARERMGSLVGVGGLVVEADKLNTLEREIDFICRDTFEFPDGEMFKWSPSKSDWMRSHLENARRFDLFSKVLEACRRASAKAIVAVCDTTKGKANSAASDHEVDAYLLALERFHTHLREETGFVIIAKPSGGNKSENKMLAECIEHRVLGTDFVQFDKISQNPVTAPSRNSRVLQASDLIVSTTTAMCSGHCEYAENLFDDYVRGLFISDWRGLVGNTGLKLHPNVLYRNVYHWILKEEFRANGSTGFPLPDIEKPYSVHPTKW